MNKKAGFNLIGILFLAAIILGALVYFKVITVDQIKNVINGAAESGSNLVAEKIFNQPSDNNNFGKVQVYFCPGDNCLIQLTSRIDATTSSLHCAFYELDSQPIIDSIKNARERGIDVWIIMDDENYAKDPISSISGMVMIDNSTADYMHNKFCIFDKETVFTGSMNPTNTGVALNNENMVFIQDEQMAKDYEDEFIEMKNGQFGKDSRNSITPFPFIDLNETKINVYFCPEDDCETALIQEINNAKAKIDFMVFSFTSDPIEAVLSTKSALKVRGVFELSQAKSEYSAYNGLKAQGFDVRYDGNINTMHNKVFIIDETTVVTGSFNPTAHANEDNDENMIIIRNPNIAKAFIKEFEKVWKVAS